MVARGGAAGTGTSEIQTLTGERTLPHIWHENYWFRRHEAVYVHLARRLVPTSGGWVLDAGCGEGYGSALLRARGHRLVGLDYDVPTLRHVARAHPGVRPVQANLVALPFPDQSFDAVISLQVIEHIWEQRRFVDECARVTRSGGSITLSTPNRVTFSPGLGRGEKPLNPFHANEFDAEELTTLVGKSLRVSRLLGLQHGSRIVEWERTHGSVVAGQLAGPYESWTPELADLVASLSADDFSLTPDDIQGSLDLVVIADRE